jgi:hypothetical protein
MWCRYTEPVPNMFPEVLLIIGVGREELPFVCG